MRSSGCVSAGGDWSGADRRHRHRAGLSARSRAGRDGLSAAAVLARLRAVPDEPQLDDLVGHGGQFGGADGLEPGRRLLRLSVVAAPLGRAVGRGARGGGVAGGGLTAAGADRLAAAAVRPHRADRAPADHDCDGHHLHLV